MTWQQRRRFCERAGIPPTSASVHRVPDALSIIHRGGVNLITVDADGTKRFDVQSQTDADTRYRVSFNGKPTAFCNCPDWRKRDLELAAQGIPFSFFHCKHSIAAK